MLGMLLDSVCVFASVLFSCCLSLWLPGSFRFVVWFCWPLFGLSPEYVIVKPMKGHHHTRSTL